MKRILARTALVFAIAAGTAAVATAPASAEDIGICILNQNTWLRDGPWGNVLRTLTAGRGFRVHAIYGGDGIQPWLIGHGAEAPWQDGYIPAANCNW